MCWFFISNFYYRLLQYLDVGLVTQVSDKTALLGTQQITSTTDVKILHGDMNA
jgi:hypothetical protein